MLRRWRSFARPDTVDPMEHPSAADALALWFLGTSWVLTGLWLAHRGEDVLVMPMLAGGLLAVLAWHREEWLRAVPWALVVAALADAACARWAPRLRVLGFLDLAIAGLALVAVARRLARRLPRDRRAPLMPWPVACGVAVVIVLGPQGPVGLAVHALALALATLATLASHRRPLRAAAEASSALPELGA